MFESEIELFRNNGKCCVCQYLSTTFEEKHLVPTAKRGARRILIWGCFTALGTGRPGNVKEITTFKLSAEI